MSTSSAPASQAGNSSQCTRPLSRQYRVTTPSCSRLKGGCFAACSSVNPCKNATASGWRSSESCLLIVMMHSSARARMRGARRSRVFGNRPRDKSMLNPDAPNCNPRNAEIGRGAKAQKQTSPKNVRCTQNGVGVCDDRNALRIRRVVQGCKCYWRAWHRSKRPPGSRRSAMPSRLIESNLTNGELSIRQLFQPL